ncbi:MAG: hypothetical protein KY475_14965 [Planctomycetes bacterium]|nr:hypothetical protein [Planctomycetota bacterium]
MSSRCGPRCAGKCFRDTSKIGGAWELRGEKPDSTGEVNLELRRILEEEWEKLRERKRTFICQLVSVETTDRQPFVNIEEREELERSCVDGLLSIADAGGFDFFYNGRQTDFDWWSG